LFATINKIIIIKDILTSCFSRKGKCTIFLFLLVNFDALRNFINVIRHVYFTQRLVRVGEGVGVGEGKGWGREGGGRGRGKGEGDICSCPLSRHILINIK
jgi:hypothetical protein